MLAQAVRFSTHELNDGQRSRRWEEWNRSALIGLSCHTPHGRGLRGEEITLELPHVTVGHVRAEPHRVSRAGHTLDTSPADSVIVYAILNGRSTFSRGNSSQHLAAGDLAIIDADRPFERTFPTAFAELAVKFPRQVFSGSSAGPRSTDSGFLHPSGLTALRVHALGRHLVDSPSSVAPVDAETISRVALDLMTDLTTSDGPGDRLALGRLLIEQNLGDPSLSASRLATTLQISNRQLSRLFADARTSFPEYVTDRRLQRATALLSQAAGASVGQVAALCGFSSPSYFSRVFRDQHGFPPGRFQPS